MSAPVICAFFTFFYIIPRSQFADALLSL